MHEADLLFWVTERESIRLKKEAGLPKPWTTDPILGTYRFCNVHREDDVVSKWIYEWAKPYWGHPSLTFGLVMARMVNLPDTLGELEFPTTWDSQRFIDTFQSRKSRGLRNWTNAYLITGGYSAGGETKEAIIARVLTQAHSNLLAKPVLQGDKLATAAEKIRSPGIGTFLAAQAVADLKMTPLLAGASDWWNWCAIGPGSSAGLNYLHERKQSHLIGTQAFIREVNEVRELIRDEVHIDLCAQDTQNCLCEFSKYVRTKYYGGKPKQTYKPKGSL